MDDAGFADLRVEELEKTRSVRLKPWAQVKGKLLSGPKTGTNETIRLGLSFLPGVDHPRTYPALSLFLTAQTDQDGNYEFDRVPPIAVQIYHEPKVKGTRLGTIAMSQDTCLVLEPGKTHQVDLGGKGRPVVGKLVVEDYEGEINWRSDVHSLESV